MIERKYKIAGLFTVLTSLTVSAVFVMAGSQGNPETYGPYQCGTPSCGLQAPLPDAGTLGFITHHDNIINKPGFFSPDSDNKVAGDKFVVCNATHCVTYERTHSGGFLGGAAIPIIQPGGGMNPPVGTGGDGAMPGAGGGHGGGCSTCEPKIPDRWGEVGEIEDAIAP